MATQPIKFVFEGDTSDLEKALAQVSRKFEKTKKESKEVAKDVSIFGRKFDQQSEKIGKFMSVNAKAFGAIAAGLGTVVLGFAAVAKAADLALAVIQKITDEALQMAEAGDEVAKSAKRIGTTAEDLQVVRFALGEGGVAAEQADMAMLKLNLRLAQVAETGKGPAADALKKLGLNARELQALPLDERMARVADAFADMESQGEKTAAAVALMEEGGLRLLSAFDGGGDAIRESAAAIREMGVISNKSAKDSEDLIEAIGRLKVSVNSLRFEVLGPLIPALTGAARGVVKIRNTLNPKEVKAFGGSLVEMSKKAVIAVAALGVTLETLLPLLKTLGLTALGVSLVMRGKLITGAATLKSAFDATLDLGDAYAKSGRKWAGWSNTVLAEMAKAIYESKRAGEEIAGNLDPPPVGGGGRGGRAGGGGAAAGGITFGPGTGVIDIEDDVIGGGVVSITDDLQFMAEQAEEQLKKVNDTVGEVARNIADLFGSIGQNISESIQANEEKILRLHERFIASRNGMEKVALQEEIRNLERKVAAEKEAALAVFFMQKALGLAEAGIRTAVSVAAALAQPPGPPATIPFGILAGVLGGAQIAAIAAEPPPSFHVGGMVAQATPDEINARLLRSEAVLSPQGVNAAGGEDGVRQLNRGGGAGQQIVSVLQVRSRTVDAMISDNLRTKQGPLVDALRAARPRALGRHNPFASS